MNTGISTVNPLAALTAALAILGLFLVVISNVVLAWATASDVDRMHKNGRETRLLGMTGWAFVVLVTGVIGIAFYWVVHHSNLRDPASDRPS